jgi:hypothetical protein
VSNELLYTREAISIPGGTSLSLCVLDVSTYREIRGFFAPRHGEITLTLQVLVPNSPSAATGPPIGNLEGILDGPNSPSAVPSPSNGHVIGILDQFVLEVEFTRTYATPGISLEVIASANSEFSCRIGQVTFIGRT